MVANHKKTKVKLVKKKLVLFHGTKNHVDLCNFAFIAAFNVIKLMFIHLATLLVT